MGLFGPPDIAKLKAKGDVQGLIKALAYHQDFFVQQAAAVALGELGDRRAVLPLADLVGNCALLMIQEANSGQRPYGWETRQSFRAIFCTAGLEALASLGDPSAAESILPALETPSNEVRLTAAQVLTALAWQPGSDAAAAAYLIQMGQWDRCVEIGPAAVGPLIAVLVRENGEEINEAAAALARIGVPAVEPLAALLNDWNTELPVRRLAADVLASIGQPTIGALTGALPNIDSGVREAAADALSRIGWQPDDSQAGAFFCAMTGQGAMCVRMGAVAVEPLIDVLRRAGPEQRLTAARALGEIGDRRAIDPLARALLDTDQKLVDVAIEALGKLGWKGNSSGPGIVYLVARHEWAQCVEIGGTAGSALVGALGSVDPGVRKGASEALLQIGEPVVYGLVHALRSSNRLVRGHAGRILTRIGDAAVEPLMPALDDSDPKVRYGAIRAIARMGSPAVDRVVALLRVSYHDRNAQDIEEINRWGDTLGRLDPSERLFSRVRRLVAAGESMKCIAMGEDAVVPLARRLGGLARIIGTKLGYWDESTHREANTIIWVLEGIGSPGAVEALKATMYQVSALRFPEGGRSYASSSQDDAIRLYKSIEGALSTLERRAFGARGVVALATDLASNGSHMTYGDQRKLVESIERMLARIVDPVDAAPLAEALAIAPFEAARPIARTLEKLRWVPTEDVAGAVYWASLGKWQKCVEVGSGTVPFLVSALDSVEFEKAAWALGQIGDDRAVDLLLPRLRDEDHRYRIPAAKALVAIYKVTGSSTVRARILAARPLIVEPYSPFEADEIGVISADSGIGVDFPI